MEDVQFLKNQAKEESYLFVVDSSKRDKYAYPSPSEYTIQFNAPFKNVIGLELLNATVPRTEYVIDEGYNGVVYAYEDGTKKTLSVPPGDYNLLQLCETMTGLMDGPLKVEPLSVPYSRTSRLRFVCDTPFTLYMSESTMRKQIGFAGTKKVYESDLAFDSTTTRTLQGPFPGFESLHVEGASSLRQPFVSGASGLVKSIILYLDETTSSQVSVRIVDGEETVYATATISPSGPSEVEVDASTPLIDGETYYFVIQSEDGADIFVNTPPDGVPPAEDDEGQLAPENSIACEVWLQKSQYEVVCPDLVDLTGVRYIVVRCPEIETYLYRERAYEPFYAGLGMVKLGGNGVREQHFDFVSFPPRLLTTPLAKLSSLTFKLEKPDGSVYNSKGIDNSLLLVVRYYSGVKTEVPMEQQRILNPHYIPQPIQYFEQTSWKQEVDERDTLHSWPQWKR